MEESQITYIGKVDYRNKLTKFGIKAKDRTKHMYVIGKTGTGKSTFLENMLIQDIQNGNGLAFIDPHGESARRMLDYIPEWRANDVIYFNPADTDFPVAFNPLEDIGPDKRHLVADGLMSVFEKIWPDAFSGRMTYILNNTMLALLESPDSSLLGINRMLTDKDYRKRVVANVTDPAVKNAWDELMRWDDKTWRDAVAALVNKVGQFTTNPVVRNIIGQTKSTFDFRRAMDERKIIIINLSKGMIGEQNAPLIGAMLITKIYLAAMSRAELPDAVLRQAAPFYFYVDEFQNFANDSFASILSEARKYKLCLTVANQYIAQMEETIRDAVFGNMGTTVAFRVGPLDAEFVEKIFAPVFTQEDLQNVMFGQYYISLQIDGMGSKPFSAQGLGPIPPIISSVREQIIEASRKQFARPKLEVDATVREWFGHIQASEKPTDRRVIRPDVGNVPTPANNKSAQGTVPQKKFDAKVFDQKPQKPLPVVDGYAKPAPAPKSQPQPKPVSPAPAPKSQPQAKLAVPTPAPAPKKDSSTLADLLGKLDTAVSVPDKKPEVSESKPAVKPIPVMTVTPPKPQPIDPRPVSEIPKPAPTKPLAREASPEKKSALAEALARAMADKEKAAPDAVQSKPATATVTTPEPLPARQEKETVQEKNTRPTVKDSPAAPLRPAYPSSVAREVPEDILRKVLE